ncbi:hypothetical protein SAMN05444167_0550 [Terriglobus roseus]|uniref:Uncharacterized protein n=1 Tax=Terriglobus roseus TaxID=392734 RepID=A0A1G7G4T8_9BACT|nr:hypothetical protein SAMN05444167_0550 [Terriglobus roseus]
MAQRYTVLIQREDSDRYHATASTTDARVVRFRWRGNLKALHTLVDDLYYVPGVPSLTQYQRVMASLSKHSQYSSPATFDEDALRQAEFLEIEH